MATFADISERFGVSFQGCMVL